MPLRRFVVQASVRALLYYPGAAFMTASEREKMAAGEWYTCIDPELEGLRARAREAIHQHNTLPPGQRGKIAPALAALLAAVAPG